MLLNYGEKMGCNIFKGKNLLLRNTDKKVIAALAREWICTAYHQPGIYISRDLFFNVHVSTSLHHPTCKNRLQKSLGFHRQWYRVLAIGLHFFTFFFEEKIDDRVDQNPMATGTVGPIKI